MFLNPLSYWPMWVGAVQMLGEQLSNLPKNEQVIVFCLFFFLSFFLEKQNKKHMCYFKDQISITSQELDTKNVCVKNAHGATLVQAALASLFKILVKTD